MQLMVTGEYSDGSTADITNKVTWENSTTAAIVQGTGLVRAQAPGITNITAMLGGITSPPKTITVVSDFEGSVTGTCSGQMMVGTTATAVKWNIHRSNRCEWRCQWFDERHLFGHYIRASRLTG